jgi:hypothetical protein
METTPGLSLSSFLYLKLAKILCLSYCLLHFLFNKIGEEEGGSGSAWKQKLEGLGMGWGEEAQTMYTQTSKCKNNKIKEEKVF